MTIDQLDNELTGTILSFSSGIGYYSASGTEPATEADIALLSDQVYYTLVTFKDILITYLKQQ